jgi:hypothetical protein
MEATFGMARPAQQECFGDAFLLAIASAAGCAVSSRRPDDDSIDWTLSCRLRRRPKLDVQMKTWTGDHRSGNVLRYPLKRKNYDDLRVTDVLVPRILVLVTLPENIEDWMDLSPDTLVLRHCVHWVSLAGALARDNETSVTVSVSRQNVLTVEELRRLMLRINNGDSL